MSDTGRFISRYTDGLANLVKNISNSPEHVNPERFEKHLNDIIEQAVGLAYLQGHKHGVQSGKANPRGNVDAPRVTPADVLDAVNSNSNLQRSKAETVGHYKTGHGTFLKAISLRSHEDWADSVDRLKRLLYTVANGIGIAIVVLATAWVAKELEIPLPMIRSSL